MRCGARSMALVSASLVPSSRGALVSTSATAVSGSRPRKVWLPHFPRAAASNPALVASKSSVFGRRLALGAVGAGVAAQIAWGAGKAFASTATKEKSIHDFTVKNIDGKDIDLSTYKGKVLLVVNIASQCGLTSGNYKELVEVHKKYKDQGFEVLAFPCNQFGGQEPGSNEEIKQFACTRYKAEFPIFDKVDVNGPSTAPVYQFLKSSKGGLLGDSIKWNFGKFLVNKDGQVVERYAPTTSPFQIEGDIKKLL
ncbi:probable phospholipid hydroperoxide glutathione peroxidase [Selaginella moellendorffii]|nr:probable phospholipid hydroperoxide glutathione peroxidase [Selaginella moellendorffii]|eukprot:XP_002979231.2 probable phospholipid hydroperoxide glutathione peroxidase [Selaginella moellendorffii]